MLTSYITAVMLSSDVSAESTSTGRCMLCDMVFIYDTVSAHLIIITYYQMTSRLGVK